MSRAVSEDQQKDSQIPPGQEGIVFADLYECPSIENGCVGGVLDASTKIW